MTTTRQHPPQSAEVEGDRAEQWIARQGWQSDTDARFQLSAVRLAAGDFSVARIWHTPARLTRPIAPDDDSVLIMIGIDGDGTMRAHDREWMLRQRQVLIADATAPIEYSTSGASARLEVRTQRQRLGLSQHLLGQPVDVLDISDSYWKTLASLIVTVVGAGVSGEDSGFVSLRASIESALTAAITQSKSALYGSGAYTSILVNAFRIIEDQYTDNNFTAKGLARQLAISPGHMHRAFATASATPYQMIQDRRTRRAAELIGTEHHLSEVEAARVAVSCGFSTSRAMRRALKQRALAS